MIEGHTTIGDGNEIFPYASIGLAPQDLKYKGEPTRLEIGAGNIFREFVTIHRGTEGGGGVTTIGDRNLFMNYVHVAHDCHVGNQTIFGPHATLGGHVAIADFVNVSAGSAVHQFCRVGAYAFIGGYSVITQGRAAVRAHGRQPAGARVRPEPDRAEAPRLRRRHAEEAARRVSLPDAVEAQYDAGDRAASSRMRRSSARKSTTSSTSSAPPHAASSCGAAGRRRTIPQKNEGRRRRRCHRNSA